MNIYEVIISNRPGKQIFTVKHRNGEPRGVFVRNRTEICPVELISFGGPCDFHEMRIPWAPEGEVQREHWDSAVQALKESNISGAAIDLYDGKSERKGRSGKTVNIDPYAGDVNIVFKIVKANPERVFYDSYLESLVHKRFYRKQLNVVVHPALRDLVMFEFVADLFDCYEEESFRLMHVDFALLNKEGVAVWIGELHGPHHKCDERTKRNDELKKKIFGRCSFEAEFFAPDDVIEVVNKVAEKYKGLKMDFDGIGD